MAREALANATGGEIHAIRADLSKEAEIRRLVDAAKTTLGGVEILVNNAGTMYSGRFAALTDDALKLQLETKLFGFMRTIRLVHPLMKAQKWGRIVNMIGGAGKEPDPYMFGSGITNSALLNLTKSLSTEFGEDNVLVNAVCPSDSAPSSCCSPCAFMRQRLVSTNPGALQRGKIRLAASVPRRSLPMPSCSCAWSARATSRLSRSISTVGG